MKASDMRYRINVEEVAAKVIDGEAVIINLADGAYYSLVGTGAVVWALLAAGRSTGEVAAHLASSFDGVDADVALSDVERTVTELVDERVIVPAAPESPPDFADVVEEVDTDRAYAAPSLEKYTEMRELLSFDPPMPGIREIEEQAYGSGQPG